MAYAAVISLKQTMQRLLNSSHISIVPPSPEILESAYKELQPLQEVLERLDSISSSSEKVNALCRQIREAACKLEDAVESHVSKQFLLHSEGIGDEGSSQLILSVDLEGVRQEINSFTEAVISMKEEFSKEDLELTNSFPQDDDDDDAVSTRADFDGKKSEMVGFSDEFSKIEDLLTDSDSWPGLETVSLVGMAGIGKTTLAKKIFEDVFIREQFDIHAWVTIGPKYQLKEILQGILAQVNPKINIDKMLGRGQERLASDLYQSVYGTRYLIVLDDIWNTEVWDYLKSIFPDDDSGSRVLLTTRLEAVAESARRYRNANVHQMPLLNKEESWHLLCEKVFGEELCPPQLVKAGKKIAENCEGLPLLIITVADLLSKAEKTSEYWKKVAEKENSVFTDAYDKILKVLSPSYKYLPLHLKACFLYMGVFPQDHEIPCSKLINMWSSEGFLEPNPSQSVEHFAVECLEELASRSLIMVHQKSSCCGIKTCGLHSVFRHLCNSEAGKNKFFYILNNYADGLAQGIKSERRLCIQKSILFGIKDVYNSMASISTARSLLCTGPHHPYPVPMCFVMKLLRVLDAFTIRFYEFPIEVLKLVQLRYLALTYNGKLPSSISKLWNLQYLIVRRHLRFKSSGDSSYLPIEIWDMQELKHLQIMGSNLPDPNCGALLTNLLTLLDVSAYSCSKGVLERVPNLKKLGIQIELTPDTHEPLSCFDHISHLHELVTLKCVIVNPELRSDIVAPPVPLSTFPLGLKKLTLSGLGYPWEELRKIGSLPNLQVLKLQCFAFRGPTWVTQGKFPMLQFLLIEDTDLARWTASYHSFPRLERLIMKHCYKLEHIPWQFADGNLQMIELADCNILAVIRAMQMLEENGSKLILHSSWDDGKLML